ncbi:MAG: hypothetical protein RBS27_01455 [Giesbergeria sp.]|jgi:hypothetical protein|nr:hypothetical protein [Giesbergeria sp.]
MSATHHTLGLIQIPRGLIWVDEFSWHPVLRDAEYSITGALLLDASTRLAGRPITLQGSEGAGWLTRATLQALQALAQATDATHALTLADGRTFTVAFAPGGNPVEATPIARPELPPSHYPYVATVRLIEV